MVRAANLEGVFGGKLLRGGDTSMETQKHRGDKLCQDLCAWT